MIPIFNSAGRGRAALSVLFAGAALLGAVAWWNSWHEPAWSETELGILRSLWIASLPPLPPDPSNVVAISPEAASLGHQLFFDTRLSGNARVACATCHQPQRRFTDGLARARAIGQSRRNTPSLAGVAWSPWFYWDGRKDSLWAQALAPMEDPAEQGSNRMRIARLLTTDPQYRRGYEALFGALPDFSDNDRFPQDAGPVANADWRKAWEAMAAADQDQVSRVFANAGKLLAAYERQLQPGPSRFDAYVKSLFDQADAAVTRAAVAEAKAATGSIARSATQPDAAPATLSADELAGLRLFMGEARCLECHNGPLFTNNEFHNTGLLPLAGLLPDLGRANVLQQLAADSFNCLGSYSDADPAHCQELIHMRTGLELIGAQRTPSLRNLEGTAPYMHMGQMATLSEVLSHYNEAPLALIGHNEAEPLGLSQRQLRQLEKFLGTLQAPMGTDDKWLLDPHGGKVAPE